MSVIDNYLDGRNAIDVLKELGLSFAGMQETITVSATGRFFVSDMYSTLSDSSDECLAKAQILYFLVSKKS